LGFLYLQQKSQGRSGADFPQANLTLAKPREFPLPPATRLTLYTDGLLEARNSAGELFDFARIAPISSDTSEQIARTAQQFGQDDDITVLTFTLTPIALTLG
jgi:serine/threonine protein phosphatase PrpC